MSLPLRCICGYQSEIDRLKKERIQISEVLIPDPDVDKNALLYLQYDAQVKELEKQKDSLKASFEGVIGSTLARLKIKSNNISQLSVRLARAS
jgi:hypothetical protein